MEKLNSKGILKFMEYIHELKHLKRRGWTQRDVPNCESISGHMYAMALMTFLIDESTGLDPIKCLQMALVHDMAEAIVGDITPYDGIPDDEKHKMELEAINEITRHIGPAGQKMYDLYKQYAEKSSAEAVFVKDLDRFDFLFTGACYEKRDKIIDNTRTHDDLFEVFGSDTFKHPFIKKLAQVLEEYRGSKYGCLPREYP